MMPPRAPTCTSLLISGQPPSLCRAPTRSVSLSLYLSLSLVSLSCTALNGYLLLDSIFFLAYHRRSSLMTWRRPTSAAKHTPSISRSHYHVLNFYLFDSSEVESKQINRIEELRAIHLRTCCCVHPAMR